MSSRSIRTMSRMDRRESMCLQYQNILSHARPCAGHPRLPSGPKTWMAGTSPAMTHHCDSATVELAQPDLLEGLADPGALILVRLEPAALHQPVSFLVPRAVREVVPKH